MVSLACTNVLYLKFGLTITIKELSDLDFDKTFEIDKLVMMSILFGLQCIPRIQCATSIKNLKTPFSISKTVVM